MAGRRLNPNSDAWGGAWGSASAWGGTWGWSWGPLYEVEEQPDEVRGGAGGGKLTPERERTNKRNKILRQQMVEEGEIALILNVLVSQGILR